jgi:hypothetical protein
MPSLVCLSFFFLNIFLVSIFVQAYYIFYFLVLFSLLILLVKYNTHPAPKALGLCGVFHLEVLLVFIFLDDTFYDFLIENDLESLYFTPPFLTLALLTLAHLFILYILGYNKTKKI